MCCLMCAAQAMYAAAHVQLSTVHRSPYASLHRGCAQYCVQLFRGSCLQIELCDLTLDDLWTLDLNKCDGWKCVKENTAGVTGQESLDEEPDEESEDSE